MIDLKPCPFCGGKAEVRRDSEMEMYYVVVCTNCPTNVGRMWFWKKQNAVNAWNRRVQCGPK